MHLQPLLLILTLKFYKILGVKESIFQHILIVRTDRIGDVLLTLPSVEAVKSKFPNSKISMLVSPYTAPLLEGIVTPLLYVANEPFLKTLNRIRNAHIDAAIIAFPQFRIALLLWLARIPVRVGTGFRWYSFLFNRKVFEHRKTVKKHEAEYNLSLVKELGCEIPQKPSVRLNITNDEKQQAWKIRRTLEIADSDPMILLHPGSGGSARDWKPEYFARLAVELKKSNYQVVITGIKKEESLIQRISQQAGNGVKYFMSTVHLRVFAAFIQSAKLFVANSTGPLHMAAAVGTPLIGFYPPIRVMSPNRWGPLTEKKILFIPDPERCPRCKGGPCMGNDCMEQISVDQVVRAAHTLL